MSCKPRPILCRGIVLLIPIVASLSVCVSGQDLTNELNIGLPPNGVFVAGEFDSVQLNNGNLHIEIPLWSTKGRGLPIDYRLIYDNKGWYFDEQCNQRTGLCHDTVRAMSRNNMTWRVASPTGYGLGRKAPILSCPGGATYIAYSYTVTEPNGTMHNFVPDKEGQCWAPLGTPLYTNDGSGWQMFVDTSNGVPKYAVNQHGTTAYFLPAGSVAVKDNNGNEITLSSDGLTLTDTMGRTAPSIPTDSLSYYDSSGTQQTIQFQRQLVPIQTSLCGLSGGDSCGEYSGNWNPISQITLPGGNLTYTISYPTTAGFGEPLSMTLPTGGQISWTWGAIGEGGRAVSTRTVNDGTHTYPWTNGTQKMQYYQGSATSGALLKTVVTDYSPFTYFDTPGTLPIRETTTWNQQNLVSKLETDWDTVRTRKSSVTLFTLDVLVQNPVERREYSYGTGAAGALIRRTHTSYVHGTNTTFTSLNLLDRLSSKIVYDGPSGATKAQETYSYDGSPLVSTGSTPAPNHDYVNFGSSYNIRGNRTRVAQWLNPGGTWLNTDHTYDDLGNRRTSKDHLLHTTTFDYTDNWKDSACTLGANTFAFLTQTTDALSHRTKSSYYRCTGLTGSTQDENDIVNARAGTAFTYDFLNRHLTVNSPDGGQTTKSYIDTGNISVTASHLVTTGVNTSETVVFDALGRPLQTQKRDPDCGGGTGLVKVDYGYGFTVGAGKFSQVSTPYCNSPDATHGLMTTTNYDALDRVTSVAQTDGSTISTTYAGTTAGLTSTVTDEAGQQRKSETDALGRMTKVWEDPSGLNYETDYAYDTLDNLTKVTQMGGAASSSWRTRTFTYDSLSRLKCAANPEVTSSVNTPASCPASDIGTYTPGTSGYTYDADGNVQTKTAPAPNQTATSSTVATTYSYDALNRLMQKSYAGGPSTATVKYGYDGVALSGCTTVPPALSPIDANPVSYRSAMCDGSGASAWAHDAMGRVLTEQRIINGTSAINKNTKYTYYKDGELNKLTYPGSGRVITYTANSLGGFSAGRSVSAIAADGTSYVSAATYAPQGAPSALTFGGTINGAFSYNKRLQPVQMFYGTNAPGGLAGVSCPATIGNIMHRAYDFHVGAGDNGNVFIVRNCLNTSRTQTVTYDSLNRIETAATQGATCTACWGQMFGHMSGTTFVPGIDAWGNLHEITATQGSPTTLTQAVSNNNQFVGMTYDAAGNLTNDGQGSTYTYDAENRLTATTATAGYSYVYDGDGKRRIQVVQPGSSIGRVWEVILWPKAAWEVATRRNTFSSMASEWRGGMSQTWLCITISPTIWDRPV